MTRTTTLIFMLFFSLGFLSLSAQKKDLSAYDKNGNDKLSQDEFMDMMRKTKVFKAWDTNDNGFVSLEEWKQGLDQMYPKEDLYSYGRYLDWDLNADHFIKDEEFWIGMFETWDEDKSQYISQEEYSKWRRKELPEDRSTAAGK